MANWCSNDVIITGKNRERLQEIVEGAMNGNFLKTVMPLEEGEYQTAVWGTKWDVDCDIVEMNSEDSIYLSFASAWSPPIGVYEKLVDEGFEVEASYFEPGMCIVGWWSNDTEEEYDYSNETSETVREFIGEELDDRYGVSELYENWEDEDDEYFDD